LKLVLDRNKGDHNDVVILLAGGTELKLSSLLPLSDIGRNPSSRRDWVKHVML